MLLRYLGNIFVLFSFFPYLSPIRNNLDSQPISILFCSLFLFLSYLKKKKIKWQWIPLGLYLVISLFLIITDIIVFGADFLAARAIINYMTVTLIPVGFYIYLTKYGFPRKLFIVSVVIYLIFGLLQNIISRDLFNFLVTVRTTTDRGVTSLAPEPTYYGIICYFSILMILIYDGFSKNQRNALIVTLLFQILVLAKSSMTVLFLLLMVSGVVLSKKVISIQRIIYLFFTFILLYSIVSSGIFEGTRVDRIVRLTFEYGPSVFTQDASMNDRLANIYLSFYGFIENKSLPGFFSTFTNLTERRVSLSNGFFWFGGNTNKIMSYLGAIVYETGIFCLVYFVTLFSAISINVRFLLFAFIVPLLSAIPLANPLPGLVIALCYYKKRINEQDKNSYVIS